MSTAPPPPPFKPDQMASTREVGKSVSEGEARVFPCDNCGADLVFNIGQQSLKCPYCGHVKQLELPSDGKVEEQDFAEMLKRMREHHDKGRDQELGEKEVRCDACGGNVVFTGTLTSSECPYCATPIQLDKIHDAIDRIAVDGVLPFQISHEVARQNLTAWVKSRWFAPNDFLEKGVEGKFNGVYLPFWTFDSLTFNSYRGERGEHYYVTVGTGKEQRQERRTRWYSTSGRFQRFFDDVLVIATQGMPVNLIIELEPWPLGKCIPFTQEVLSGFLARTYDTELEQGFQAARSRIDEAITQDVRQRIGGDEQRIHDIDTNYTAVTFKHLLLPVWLMAYRYHDEAFRVFVNAATGEVQGERPYSWIKITFAVILGIIAAGIFFYFWQ